MFGAYSYLSKIDSSGNIIWEKAIQLGEEYFSFISDVIIVDSINFLVLGTRCRYDGNSDDIFLAKFNSYGNNIWIKGFGGQIKFCDSRKLIRTQDNGFIILGNRSLDYIQRTSGILLIKTDSIGNLLWSKSYDASEKDYGISCIETESGNLLLACQTYKYGSSNVYLLNLNSQGDTIWTKVIGGTGYDIPSEIILLNQDEFLVTGISSIYESENGFTNDVLLLRMNMDGDIIYNKSYGGIANDKGNYLLKDENGDLLLIGSTQSFGFGQEDIYVLKITQDGDTIWTKAYGGNLADEGVYICSEESGYTLLGNTRSFSVGGFDMCIIQIDNEGSSNCRSRSTNTEIFDNIWDEHHIGVVSDGCSKENIAIQVTNVSIQINDMCDCISPTAKFQWDVLDTWVTFYNLSTWVNTWLWDFDDGETSIEENPGHEFDGEYYVCLTVENECGIDTYCEWVWGSIGINDHNSESLLEISPNPADDWITINCNNNLFINLVDICDMLGRNIYSLPEVSQQQLKIATNNLKKGVYLVKILTSDNFVLIEKLIIK